MYLYNVMAIVEDKATLGSDLSATMAAYSIGRYLFGCRPLSCYVAKVVYDYAVAFNAINPSRFAAVFL